MFLHLPIRPLKTCPVLEPVQRFELITYHTNGLMVVCSEQVTSFC